MDGWNDFNRHYLHTKYLSVRSYYMNVAVDIIPKILCTSKMSGTMENIHHNLNALKNADDDKIKKMHLIFPR